MDVEDAELSKKKLSPPPIVKFQWPQYKAKDSALFKVKENISNEEPAKKENSLIRQIKIIEDDEIKKLKERAVKQIKRTIKKDVKLVMGEKELHGTDRFLADGFAQEYECRKLMEIAQIAAVQGDGYTGNKSPHSEHEKFEGLTLGRAALLVYFGLMDPDDLELYLNISERGRDYVERHFNLKKKLQFNFTHLVCRTALLSSSTNRSDMSHAVHADNCNLLPNGTCTKQPPAYTWRDYSAIIYLNDDFEGGEFIFAADIKAKNVQSIVRPKCGRLIGFSAGKENLHGVYGVKKGSRCAIGLWFTFNETHLETERMLAIQVLQQVQQEGTITNQLLRELKRYVTFDVPQDSKPKRNENTDVVVDTKSSVLHEVNEERKTRVLSNIHGEKSEIDTSKTSRLSISIVKGSNNQ